MPTTIWINNVTGNDGNPGTQGSPKASFSGALTIGAQGDTIRAVNTGTNYSGPLNYGLVVTGGFQGTDYDTDPGLIIEGWPDGDWPVVELPIDVNPARYWLRISGTMVPYSPADYIWVRNFHFTCAVGTTYRPWVYYLHKMCAHVRLDCSDFGGEYPWYGTNPIRVDPTGDVSVDNHIEVAGCLLYPAVGGFNIYMVEVGPWKSFWLHHCLFIGGPNGGNHAVSFANALGGLATIEHNTFYEMTQGVVAGAGGVIYCSGAIAIGNLLVKDNIFAGATVAFYCSNNDNATITEEYNCYWDVTDFCNLRPADGCRCNINAGAGMSPTSILIDPDFVGGGFAQWLYGLTFTTSLEPMESQVLTGGHDGNCMGGWLPGAELYPLRCALAFCDVDSRMLVFGDVAIGYSEDLTFTITNLGSDILAGIVTSPCAEFKIIGNRHYSLGHNESKTFTVRFTPTETGPASCGILLGDDCGEVSALGRGVIGPCPPCPVGICNYVKFTGAYPDDWQELLARPKVPPYAVVVCYDPDGEALQLTPYVSQMRPVKQERDIIFAEYKGGDTDIEFNDPLGLFDPHRNASILYGKAWFGKFVDIGVWLVGTTSVLMIGRYFLADVRPSKDGTTIWRLQDIFAWLIQGETRANDLGVFAATTTAGTIDYTKASCDETVCRQQTWTLTFTTATDFTLEGSKIGADGIGSTGADFLSTSGSVAILSTFWGGVWVAGETVTFKSGLRYTGLNVITAARDMLVALSDIPEAWLDLPAWSSLEATSTAYKITYWSDDVDDPLSLLRLFMRHRFATAYPTHEGKISVMTFEPDPSQFVERCLGKRWNLSECEPEHLSILNVLSSQIGLGETSSPTSGAQYPAPGEANPSVVRYQTEYPYTFTLRGYISADYSLVRGILQAFYASRAGLPANPRQLYKTVNKMSELNVVIGEVVYLDSARPVRTGYGLVVEVSKDVASRKVNLTLLDVSDIIEPPSGCGYGFCGGQGTTDDCWVYG